MLCEEKEKYGPYIKKQNKVKKTNQKARLPWVTRLLAGFSAAQCEGLGFGESRQDSVPSPLCPGCGCHSQLCHASCVTSRDSSFQSQFPQLQNGASNSMFLMRWLVGRLREALWTECLALCHTMYVQKSIDLVFFLSLLGFPLFQNEFFPPLLNESLCWSLPMMMTVMMMVHWTTSSMMTDRHMGISQELQRAGVWQSGAQPLSLLPSMPCRRHDDHPYFRDDEKNKGWWVNVTQLEGTELPSHGTLQGREETLFSLSSPVLQPHARPVVVLDDLDPESPRGIRFNQWCWEWNWKKWVT